MTELDLPDGEPERGETWTADCVQLQLFRPAWLRTFSLVLWLMALCLGSGVSLGVFLVQGSVWSVALTLGFGVLWLALLFSVVMWLQVPIRVTIGPDRLAIAGREVSRLELVRVRREGKRYVLTVRGQADWRSPQVEPVDPERLLALMQGAVPEPRQVEEDRLQELHAQQELQTLRER